MSIGMQRGKADRVKPTRPTRLTAPAVAANHVVLTWRAAKDDRAGAVTYEVLRNGRRVARKLKGRRFTDKDVKPGTKYRYAVRAVDRAGNRSRLTLALTVKVPAAFTPPRGTPTTTPPRPGSGTTPAPAPATTPDPGATSGGTPTGPQPGPPAPAPVILTTRMVDRMFWRAGFGPTQQDRDEWTGRPVADLVAFFLDHPVGHDDTVPPPLTQQNGPIDPTVSSAELVMDWLYDMQRARNPLPERLTLWLHGLWCVSRLSGEIPNTTLIQYRDRLRRHADLPSDPQASFRRLAYEMTTQDGAMSFFLDAYQNTKNRPNENYAREFMELFCLGVRDANGTPNYTQQDVLELARAFTGWRINQNPGPDFGKLTFSPTHFDGGQKTILGRGPANFGADPARGSGTLSAIDVVLEHPAHAPFVVHRLWSEFIVSPIPDRATHDALVAAYRADGQYLLKPLVRAILSHPLMFESLDEPNMIKPPIVYLVGQQRALRSPMRWFFQHEVLQSMQQAPYEAPNVAGWEGGLSWLNTNTVVARFDAARRTLHMKHNGTSGYPGSAPLPDLPAETPDQCFERAYQHAGRPWLSDASVQQIKAFAAAHPAANATARLQRVYAVIALILGGPDAQVM